MLSAADLQQFADQLNRLRAELIELLDSVGHSSKPVELDQNKVGRLSRMDALQGQALAQASMERQQQRLVCIDRALQRLKHDDYGRCLDCDEFIAQGRLQVDPAIELCIRCASNKELT